MWLRGSQKQRNFTMNRFPISVSERYYILHNDQEAITMPRFSEETLNGWRKPPSDTEETKLSNIERMVKECINADSTLSSMRSKIKIFGQGSYVNDTNVRLNSDVDLNVQYRGGFYFDLPAGMTRSDFGLNTPISYSASDFKNNVQSALVRRFGSDVRRKNKCLAIEGNTNRVGADVVPTWGIQKIFKGQKLC